MGGAKLRRELVARNVACRGVLPEPQREWSEKGVEGSLWRLPPLLPVIAGAALRAGKNTSTSLTVFKSTRHTSLLPWRSESILRPVYELLSHPVFLSAFFSWLIAQLIKAIIGTLRHSSRTPGELVGTIFWQTGGMPSSHSSMMTGITTSIGFTEGPTTPVFILSFFFSLVVVRDALGVRRAAGEIAQALNRIGMQLNQREGITFNHVKEINGHTAAEVSVGILLGFFLGVAFSIL